MTTVKNAELSAVASSSVRRLGPDVVAGLVRDGNAYHVARAAVREAAHRSSRVRFIQVAPPGLSVEERASVDGATFRSALRALHGLHPVPCTFEVLHGDPGQVLVRHSMDAALLVVGRDLRPEHEDQVDGHDVARQCQENAGCDVLIVFGDGSATTE
ncbi:hypothetical protein ACPPVT_06535 [Angustibacter sp. McL0619]|uniref:hypothetical protein n=1 Tax=Angustibacter sp. McL0619 TaxID=3415676 RepID=UPI003CFACD7E